MLMNRSICEQCCHKGVCYKYDDIITGRKSYNDFFCENVPCSDLIILTTNENSKSEEQIVDINAYDIAERYEDCTVEILKNSVTGKISVGWWRNENPPFLCGID